MLDAYYLHLNNSHFYMVSSFQRERKPDQELENRCTAQNSDSTMAITFHVTIIPGLKTHILPVGQIISLPFLMFLSGYS